MKGKVLAQLAHAGEVLAEFHLPPGDPISRAAAIGAGTVAAVEMAINVMNQQEDQNESNIPATPTPIVPGTTHG